MCSRLKVIFFFQPDQPSNKRCREKLLETINSFSLKGKQKKYKAKFKAFLAGGALPPALKEGDTASTDEDEDDDPDKSSSSQKGTPRKRARTSPPST